METRSQLHRDHHGILVLRTAPIFRCHGLHGSDSSSAMCAILFLTLQSTNRINISISKQALVAFSCDMDHLHLLLWFRIWSSEKALLQFVQIYDGGLGFAGAATLFVIFTGIWTLKETSKS